jgi:transglutaminase-like putative cysteine protease
MTLNIHHQLLYQYSDTVHLEPHLLHVHPLLGPYLQLQHFELRLSPTPTQLYQTLDAESNIQHIAFFSEPTQQFTVETNISIQTSLSNPFDFVLYPFDCQRIPFEYPKWAKSILSPYLATEGITPMVSQFARQLASEVQWNTLRFFTHLNEVIRSTFAYEIREEGSPMTPERTLTSRLGSCRDYVVLFMAACRSLGIAARFVSGYYFGDPSEPQYLHAWAEVYLPGAGWRGFDPTQNCMAADSHIPLAASALPERVTPVWGTFRGSAQTHLLTYVSIEEV